MQSLEFGSKLAAITFAINLFLRDGAVAVKSQAPVTIQPIGDGVASDDKPHVAGSVSSSAAGTNTNPSALLEVLTVGANTRRRRFRMVAGYSSEFDGNTSDDIMDMTTGVIGGPMSIEFTARWDDFKKWSRIVDLGSGPRDDNIIISNTDQPGQLAFYVYDGSRAKGFKIDNAIEKGVFATYLATVSDTGYMKVWKNGKLIGEFQNGAQPNKAARKYFYVGKSNWDTTPLFVGSIKDLYIWPGEAVRWGSRDVIE
eukprot:TRINITY_DN31068_c0_g1_i1.p1 TRINITY_DN31068_c0_g1~~TRINITY_DN31068_c0_g1_i1.p1  ORF type:complete len:255 (+),score=39.26 TRINITY_DN31068_c0_g1_i1:185-949(+)